jgi:uncharacterized protein YbbK (DUF523 family)
VADPASTDELPPRPEPPLPIAISQCLLGSEVRYDGSGARSSFPHAALDGLFEYRGICPEVGIGMGTPRAPIRLVGDPDAPRVVGVADPTVDVTAELHDYGLRMASTLGDAVGYVFMKNSPSCGLYRVKVYPHDGQRVTGAPLTSGRGAYAAAVTAALPDLPAEENGRLHDPVLRKTSSPARSPTPTGSALDRAGLEPAAADRVPQPLQVPADGAQRAALSARRTPARRPARRSGGKGSDYIALLMDGLSVPATRRGHANVLSHLQGYFKSRSTAPPVRSSTS